jgi:hypothetical protein
MRGVASGCVCVHVQVWAGHIMHPTTHAWCALCPWFAQQQRCSARPAGFWVVCQGHCPACSVVVSVCLNESGFSMVLKQRDLQMHEGSFPSLITTCCPPTRAGVPTAIRETSENTPLFWAASPCFAACAFVGTALFGACTTVATALSWRVRTWWGSNQRPYHHPRPQDLDSR